MNKTEEIAEVFENDVENELETDVDAGLDEFEASEDSEDIEQEEEQEDSDLAEDRKWYIVQCYSSQEYRVKARIEQLIERKAWEKVVTRVLVPEEETIEIKNNKRIEKTAKIYPGYIFIESIADESIWFEIRRITGVAKFVGTKNMPTPVVEGEILKVLRKIGDKTKKIEIDFETGEIIKVIGGPFRGYSGPISEINAERGKLKALISIFGRETPVELDFNQIEQVVS